MSSLRKQIEKKTKSFMELREEKIERFKRLSESVIGEPSKKLAFENMHFMEDKQWVKLSDVLDLLPNYDIHPKGERVCIPIKQLESMLDMRQSDVPSACCRKLVKKLLEESKCSES